MIIESINITNFGLYKGDNTIQLGPDLLSRRNITVLSGQNGVGKSTLQEAIHLCLLGSLSIDNRLSEANYEKYLFKRCYKGHREPSVSRIELVIEFIKSGAPVRYKIARRWNNDPVNIDEQIQIEENGKLLEELTKKEKNLFLRELIQPGLAKVMFFDGEKLLSLYDENNLTAFIAESCRFLFGLNFVDLLNTDLNYYVNKLYAQQDASQLVADIQKTKDELVKIAAEIIALGDEKAQLDHKLSSLRTKAIHTEREVSDQGRWATNELENLKREKQQLEIQLATLKKELIESYSALGPFVFCQGLLRSLKDRLVAEQEIDKWQHARDFFNQKIKELERSFSDRQFLSALAIDETTGKKIVPAIKDLLLSTPKLFADQEVIYHEMADGERMQLVSWIDEVLHNVVANVKSKSLLVGEIEDRLKSLTREQSSFSKDDILTPLLKQLQEVNKELGAAEQKLSSLNKRIDETNKRREFYSGRQLVLEQRMQVDTGVDERLKLATKTKQVLEDYGHRLLSKKLEHLRAKVLEKFNLLCRKDSYLDELTIDPHTFEIRLSRQEMVVEHAHLSAGEKQLLIISFLWGLRELTNIALPLIIDTPLARLDTEHRRAFVEQFLPAIHPQVILIGTDIELAGDVTGGLTKYIAQQYLLEYDHEQQASKLTTVERPSWKGVASEV
ncbi:MAG: DNA sulfur modification protein DndD [Mucilaginibacter sp.]|nr:DNA sulfur modification protein DndD [Mucilaginibacter sp.]